MAMSGVNKVLGLILITLYVHHVGYTIFYLYFPHHVFNHTPGPCHLVGNIVNGSEDIQMMSNGVGIMTSGLKSSAHPLNRDREGALYLFDFNHPEAGVSRLQVEGVDIYNPHGLSIWEDPHSDHIFIFVVNHLRTGEDRVEKLELLRGQQTARHRRSFSDPLLIYLNDIVAVGPDAFYATNIFWYKNPVMFWIEEKLMLFFGSVVYFDGNTARIVADGMGSLNGINLSQDRRFLYVTAFEAQTLHIFDRLTDGSLHHKEAYPLHTHPDNIDVSNDTGDLWIGCQPDLNKILGQVKNPSVSAPSQVLHLKMAAGHVTSVQEVFADRGQTLCGSSTAVFHQGALLIGTAFHKLLYCEVLHMD